MSYNINVDDWYDDAINLKAKGFSIRKIAVALFNNENYRNRLNIFYKQESVIEDVEKRAKELEFEDSVEVKHLTREEFFSGTTLKESCKTLANAMSSFGKAVDKGFKQVDKVTQSKSEPVILYYDLECSPTNAFIWRRFKENISQAQILNEWYLLTQSWAFNDGEVQGSKLSSKEAIEQDDEVLVSQVWHLLHNADIIVGHNLRRFDIKKVNARFAYYNYPAPSPYKIIDTLEICKSKFAFPSNKLNDVCEYLGIGVKADTGGFSTWSESVKGNEEALEHMLQYNLQDVHLTRELYKRLRGFDNNAVNASVMVDQTGMICSTCCSDDVEIVENKFVHTPNGKYQAYKCNSCGTSLRHTSKIGQSNKLVRVVV